MTIYQLPMTLSVCRLARAHTLALFVNTSCMHEVNPAHDGPGAISIFVCFKTELGTGIYVRVICKFGRRIVATDV